MRREYGSVSAKSLPLSLSKEAKEVVHAAVNGAEEVRMEVNSWALRHTNGLIKNLLPPGSVTNQTIKIYGNALYFKGAWENKFGKSMTIHKPFHLVNGKQVLVPFMKSYERKYMKAYNGFKVLRILQYRVDYKDTSRQFSIDMDLNVLIEIDEESAEAAAATALACTVALVWLQRYYAASSHRFCGRLSISFLD
ncbi:putative Serpin family protein [Arabidopsis thaliana]|uniref:Serine protease inhibitor (SERPIN) family protein n=2 Tax=Arabidopsis TaxID=3701 RepID=F4I826_ARATH|nr:Serine protease inhibitor (SERPIN) family protein [Arabidopsis thaliana]AEE32651.1 Serine protease inhibitor (SERPIN) family protein [Arabidopsis thaliana]KAG7657132.1 Serpin domain [Arabidopsis suecica]|eukprot:NP_175544.1 Serine protease inhibitor (SERPIN) family protein [Arabidopsis thaliana]